MFGRKDPTKIETNDTDRKPPAEAPTLVCSTCKHVCQSPQKHKTAVGTVCATTHGGECPGRYVAQQEPAGASLAARPVLPFAEGGEAKPLRDALLSTIGFYKNQQATSDDVLRALQAYEALLSATAERPVPPDIAAWLEAMRYLSGGAPLQHRVTAHLDSLPDLWAREAAAWRREGYDQCVRDLTAMELAEVEG